MALFGAFGALRALEESEPTTDAATLMIGTVSIVQDDVNWLFEFMKSWNEIKLDGQDELPAEFLNELAERVRQRVMTDQDFVSKLGLPDVDLPEQAFQPWQAHEAAQRTMVRYLAHLTGVLLEQQGGLLKGEPTPV